MGYLHGVDLADAVKEIRAAAFHMPVDGGSQGSSGGGPPPPNCLVLVAPDADAICASIIIERVLTGEKVLHTIVPVAGYTEVVKQCRAFGPNLRSVVLLNCGGVPDIGALLWPDTPEDPEYLADWWALPAEAHVYIIDAHRPFKHHNVRDESRVTVLDLFPLPHEGDDVPRVGDSDAEDELQEDEEGDDGSDGSQAEEGSDEDDDEEGGGDEEGGTGTGSGYDEKDGDGQGGTGGSPSKGGKKRRRLRKAGGRRSDDEDDDGSDGSQGSRSRGSQDDEGGDDRSSNSGASSARRRRRRQRRADDGSPVRKQQRIDVSMRERNKMRAERFRRYYGGHHYGTPAAMVAYEVAELMAYDRNDLLWLAVVGLTEHFLLDHIDRATYETCFGLLREKVMKLNDEAAATREDEFGTRSKALRFGFIRPSLEPRFVAYRHWSLDASMFYSEYVSTRLRDTDPDSSFESLRRQLDRLPPLCGVPAKLFKQDYRLMPAEERKRFFTKLETLIRGEGGDGGASVSFGDLTEDLMYESFVKQKDMEAEVSAGDVVYAMHGLLIGGAQAALAAAREERLAGLMSEGAAAARDDGGSGSGGGGEDGTQVASSSSSSSSAAAELHTSVISTLAGKEWVSGWIAAKDCLRKPDLFYRGLASYMALRQAVHRIGAPFASTRQGLILDGAIVRLATFADGEGGGEMTDGDRRLFAQPMALQALGSYIIRLNRDALGRWRKRRTGEVDTKPLLIVVVHPKAGPNGEALASIQGFPVKEADHDAAATHFADAFRAAAEMAGVAAFMDGFDSCAMLITDDSRHKVLNEIDVNLRELE